MGLYGSSDHRRNCRTISRAGNRTPNRDLLAIENVTTLAEVSTWADQIRMQHQTAPTLIRLSGEQIILRSTVKWLEKARTAYAAGANKIAKGAARPARAARKKR
jgi:hypothetical protein